MLVRGEAGDSDPGILTSETVLSHSQKFYVSEDMYLENIWHIYAYSFWKGAQCIFI